MPIYLCQTVGTGAKGDPIRPPFREPGSGWISLVPPGATSGRGLLYLPTPTTNARLTQIADVPGDRPSTGGRNAMGNALGITFDSSRGTRVSDLMAELLMDRGAAGLRWKGIRGFPSRLRNQHEIYLGALGNIWAEPVAPSPSTQSFSETWPTNGTTISSGQDQVWTEQSGDSEVSGGVLRAPAFNTVVVRCESVLDTANQSHLASWTLGDPTIAELQVSVCVRHTDGENTYRLYFAAVAGVPDTYARELFKAVLDVGTEFAADQTNPGSSGTMQILVDGATITGKLNGAAALGPATDGSPELTAVRTGGIFVGNDLLATDATLDNHTIADIVAAQRRFVLH